MRRAGRAELPCAALLAVCASSSTTAHAQLARLEAAQETPSPEGVAPLRWPDVAYDAASDAYLVVSGAGRLAGLVLDGGGVPRGAPFLIDAGADYAQAPRATALPEGGFLVAWHASVGDQTELHGRVVTPDGALVTEELVLSPPGTNWEMGAAIAAGPDVALVAWQSIPERRIVAQRIDLARRAPLGEPIVVDPQPIYFRDPAVAYDPARARFVIAYADCASDGACAVHAQRLEAASGALVGVPILLDDHLDAAYVPELAWVAHTEEVLVAWYARSGFAATFLARTIDGDGALGPRRTVTTLGSYDASSLAYAARSGTVLFVSHGTGAEDLAIELDASGEPLGEPLAFGRADASGNFNPRVAASAREPAFLAVTSTEFATLTSQRFTTASIDPALALDAGVTLDAATSAVSDAGASGGDAGPRTMASGCACRTQPVRGGGGALCALGALGALARRRQRASVARREKRASATESGTA